jgi:predicted alpha/beta superfamily hydrolase
MTPPSQAAFSTTSTQILHSEQTGEEYQISIGLPLSYNRQSSRKYPLVVLLDANLFFNLLTDTARVMHMFQSIPEVIVVGIGYPIKSLIGEDFKRFVSHRVKDFTPAQSRYLEGQVGAWLGGRRVETGGAGKFLSFIREELLPLVEANYPADPNDRTLVGHSLSGLFALHALFQEPRVFHRFVSGSPAIGYGGQSLLQAEQDYARTNADLPANLYLAIGSEAESALNPLDSMISVPDFYDFTSRLEQRAYPRLRLTRNLFEGHSHYTIPGPAFQAGLRAVFAG